MKIVIHELLKNAGKDEHVKARYCELLTEPSPEEIEFIGEVSNLFKKHQAGKIFGVFEENKDVYRFSTMLEDWNQDKDFLRLSQRAAKALVAKMDKIGSATGGYFFAVQIDEDGENTVFIFMLNQKLSPLVNVETLRIQKAPSLKTEQLDLAARIRINAWRNNERAPVSVIRGRKEVSEYFKEFIGLHQPHSNTEATHKITDFSDGWMDGKQWSYEKKYQARQRVLDYVKEIGDKPVELHAVAGLIDPENRETFIAEANEQGIDAEFYVDRRSLKAWERVRFSDKDVTVNFSKRALGKKRVIYSAEKRTLLITEVDFSPEDLS